jgi:hypothetical protein
MSCLGDIVRAFRPTYFEILRALRKGSERLDGIEVHGRQEFRRAVISALLLLRDNKLPAWETLTQHVSSILEARTTDAVVTAHPAFMFISEPHSGQGPELLAGTRAES